MSRFSPRYGWRALAVALVCLSAACARTSSNNTAQADNTPGVTPVAAAPEFDAAHSFALLQAQCDFGPRNMGSEGHEKCLKLIEDQLKPVVDEMATQKWKQYIPKGPGAGNTYAMTNVLGLIRGSDAGQANQPPALLLCAHWDTRPVADQDPNLANRATPILGANDGASGVAALLEIARVLKANRPTQNVEIAFWDGEDLGEFFYGARYFARTSKLPEWKQWRPKQAILIDMIGGKGLQCNHENNSAKLAPELWQRVMSAATDIGQAEHFNGRDLSVGDDHIPLNAAGIPSIDLIDFNYPSWHTLQDTPDKCSPDSLQVIGDVLLRVCRELGKA